MERKMIRSIVARDWLSVLPNAGRALLGFLTGNDGTPRRYNPAAHYMRGPGPKWREKHALRRSAGS
jgi:hypothetical protein